MPEAKGSLNLRAIPISVIRRAKSAAALQGVTLREWVLKAIEEKLKRK
jgi:predicted HicB family RNase H-like nuclease